MKLSPHRKLSGYQLKKAQEDQKIKQALLKGSDGRDGEPGKDGNPGESIKGDPGEKGESGASFTFADLTAEQKEELRGKAGEPGKAGENGKSIKGDPGKAGKNGRGIESLAIIKGNLWVFYDDGTEQNLGPVRDEGRNVQVIGVANKLDIINKTESNSHIASDKIYIRQTVSGITTTLTGGATGDKLYIKNTSTGSTTVSATIDGFSSVQLQAKESLTLVYNGLGFDIV